MTKRTTLNLIIVLSFILFFLAVLFTLYQAFVLKILPTLSIQITVLLGMVFCLLDGIRFLGKKKIIEFFLITMLITSGAELLGVKMGIFFGEYSYNIYLGEQFLDLVPYIIPPAWFMMLYPSYIIALFLIKILKTEDNTELTVAILGAVIMTTWDIVIDPVMVSGSYWKWEVHDYYGIPYTNFLGWFIVSFIVLFLFGLKNQIKASDFSFSAFNQMTTAYYGLIGLSSAIAAIGIGLFVPALLGLTGIFLWVGLALRANYSNFRILADEKQLN